MKDTIRCLEYDIDKCDCVTRNSVFKKLCIQCTARSKAIQICRGYERMKKVNADHEIEIASLKAVIRGNEAALKRVEDVECKCIYKSDCHGIEMINASSGKSWAIGGTNHKDRWKFCPWCGGSIKQSKTM